MSSQYKMLSIPNSESLCRATGLQTINYDNYVIIVLDC